MLLSKKIEAAINEQINHELDSSYAYLALTNWCEQNSWPGAANWFRVQAGEEVEHAMKLVAYINDCRGVVTLGAIPAPAQEYASLLAVFEAALGFETLQTKRIGELYELCLKEKAFAAQIALQWFVSEQVEEEKNATAILDKLRRIGQSGSGLLYLDKELGKRTKGVGAAT